MPFDASASWQFNPNFYSEKFQKGLKGDSFNKYTTPAFDTGGDVMAKYTKGMPSFEESYTKNWNANPQGFLNTWMDKLKSDSSQGAQSVGGGAAYGGSSSDGSIKQVLPGFSMYDPNAGKSPWTVGGMPGQESPWAPLGQAALGLGMSVLNPIAGAAGSKLAGSMFGKG